jgi:hypothetical protein
MKVTIVEEDLVERVRKDSKLLEDIKKELEDLKKPNKEKIEDYLFPKVTMEEL